MRALLLDAEGPRLQTDRDVPEPPAGEVRVRPTVAGVCATDLELCKGYMGYRGVLGHEFVGTVEAVGPGVDPAWRGQRVVGTINCVPFGDTLAPGQRPEHYPGRTVLGILGRDGCFADHFLLPEANLLKVPDHLADRHAVFTEPLAAAYEILEQMDVKAGQRVTVLGDGRLGLLCGQVLAQTGATVRLVGKHASKLALAESWGMQPCPLDTLPLGPGQGLDQDVVVDATGSSSGIRTALQLVRPRGTLVMKTTVATSPGEPPLDLAPIVIHELTVLGSRCGPFDVALAALADGKIDVEPLISAETTLDEGVAALERADQRGVLKVLMHHA